MWDGTSGVLILDPNVMLWVLEDSASLLGSVSADLERDTAATTVEQ